MVAITNKRLKNLVVVFSVISGIMATMTLLAKQNTPDEYNYLFLLPLAHVFITIILVLQRTSNLYTVPIAVFATLYTIRNTVTPMLMGIYNFDSMFGTLQQFQINNAIYLMIYETVIMYIGLIAISPRQERITDLESYNIVPGESRGSVYTLILVLLLAFFLYGYFTLPELRQSYYAIFNQSAYYGSDKISRELDTIYSGSARSRYLYILCKYMQKYLIFAISAWGLEKLYNIYCKSQRKIYIILSFLIIPAQFFFMSDANLVAFITAFCIFYALGKIYPKYKKRISRMTIIAGSIALIAIVVVRFTAEISNYSRHGLSAFFQAYFPGVTNFGGLFNFTNTDYWMTLINDIFHGMPFKTTLIGEGDYRLATYYASQNRATGQIIPCVGQIGHYTGYIIAPFLQWIYIYIAKKSYFNSQTGDSILGIICYILTFVYAVITPVMYNTTIFLSHVFQRIIPILLLIWIRKIKIRAVNTNRGI